MFYNEYKPEKICDVDTIRNNIKTKVINDLILPEDKSFLYLINSGTGSGKTNMAIDIAKKYPQYLKIIISPFGVLKKQTFDVFNKSKLFCCIDIESASLLEINSQIKQNVVAFMSGVRHKDDDFTTKTNKLLHIVHKLNNKGIKTVVIIDELDQQFTHSIGGAQINPETSKKNMKAFNKFIGKTHLLNLFVKLKERNAHVIGMSATLNNLICTKLHMTGFPYDSIHIFNIFPIRQLYNELKIKSIDTSDFDNLDSYLQIAEIEENKKILLIFSECKNIKEFINWYERKYSKRLSYVEYTSKTKKVQTSPKFKKSLINAKYIIGVEMLCTGFDLSSHVENVEFSLGILFRKLSDRSSNAISGNPSSNLYSETSAMFIQTVSRLRKGGIFLTPTSSKISLYRMQYKISEIIRDGHSELVKVGPLRNSEIEWFFQSLLLSIIQNFREEKERVIIDNIINNLPKNNDLTIKQDFKSGNFDHNFWIIEVRKYWQNKLKEFVKSPNTIPEFRRVEEIGCINVPILDDMEDHGYFEKPDIHLSGGGGSTREISEEIKKLVKERSNGICGHCSRLIRPGQDYQIAHIKRNDQYGGYTLDNLLFTHRSCDSSYDDGLLILDIVRGVYWINELINYEVDKNQYYHISKENILDRWNWEKNKSEKWGENLTDDMFRDKLIDNGYKYCNMYCSTDLS